MEQHILNPIIQYGFAGMCAVLLAILVWLINKLLGILDKNNQIIAANTEAIKIASGQANDTYAMLTDLRDRILQLECVKGKK